MLTLVTCTHSVIRCRHSIAPPTWMSLCALSLHALHVTCSTAPPHCCECRAHTLGLCTLEAPLALLNSSVLRNSFCSGHPMTFSRLCLAPEHVCPHRSCTDCLLPSGVILAGSWDDLRRTGFHKKNWKRHENAQVGS